MKNLTIEEAERISGMRLDRRRKYFLYEIDEYRGEEVCFDEKYLEPCSGCHETGDYGTLLCGRWDGKRKMEIGVGCSECGHTGVRRTSFPCPVTALQARSE